MTWRWPGGRSSAARAVAVAVAFAVGVAVAPAGCGPLLYASEVGRASDAVDAARLAGAERHAPYWWTRATQYLQKARELAGRADFQAANRYGRLAAEAANLAEQEATIAARDPARRLPDGRPAVAPAKDARDTPGEPAPAPAPPPAPAKDPR